MLEPLYNFMDLFLHVSWLEPQFMKRALLSLLFIAPACAAMGVLVVNFRMAFFSDAVSHSAFTGVALGVLFGINPMITLILLGILVGFGVTRIKERSELPTDTIIGVFFSLGVALGIVIISARRALSRTLDAFLYGNVLAVTDGEVVLMSALLVAVILFLAFGYNRLFLIGINEALARTGGVRVKLHNYAFAAMLALVVTVAIRIVGILLVTAMLIVPGACARNLARSAGGMFWYAVAVGLISSLLGLAVSFEFNTATGAMVILISGALFILTYPLRFLQNR